jgi:hypothetical protein
MPKPRKLLITGLLFTAACGCGPDAKVQQYVARPDKGSEQKVLTSDLLRSRFKSNSANANTNTASVPFRWTVPKDWQTASQDQFSQFAWNAGPNDAARITVTGLPGTAGIEPQFVRWGGQIKLDTSDPAALLQHVQEIPLGTVKAQWIELVGPSETILGMIVPYGDQLWVVKLKAENTAAAQVRESFRKFCESWQVG